MRRRAAGAAAACGLALLSLLALETLSRFFLQEYALPVHFVARVENWHYDLRHADHYRLSPGLGFEPIPGRGEYGEHGVLKNAYPLEKREGVYRVLFLGDSVTHRGAYVRFLGEKLTKEFPDRPVELWNAGVEGYNAVQYARYFAKVGVRLRPDLCVVGFHMNDFTSTPVAYREGGRLIVFSPGRSIYKTRLYCEPLFRHSTFYRAVLRVLEHFFFETETYRREIAADAFRALIEIRNLARENDAEVLALIFPYLKPLGEYSGEERANYEELLARLTGEGIPAIDLHPLFERAGPRALRGARPGALSGGPDDPWHPNETGHEIAAEALLENFRKRWSETRP